MKIYLRYLILCFTLCLSGVCFGQSEFDFDSDTIHISSDTTEIEVEEPRGLVQAEGGSANRGTVYYFYEKLLNVGIPDLRFIDTTKSLFHRYEPHKRNNRFRADRGNVGLAVEDLEYVYTDNILFSYGKSPFELYRYTPFNTKFYQNVDPYVEMYYVFGGEREQNFRVLYTQNVMRGLNAGAEYNVINSPGVFDRTYTRHNNIRLFSNFISKDQNYRAVAGYYYNKFESNENGGVMIPYDSLQLISNFTNKKVIPVRLRQSENIWTENSFYLKQAYRFGLTRGDSISKSRINFGSLSHALEVTRFRTVFNDRDLNPTNYPAIYRDSARTFDSTFVGLVRNTFSWNIGDVTSFRNSQFLNLSIGVTSDLAQVRTDSIFWRNFNYLYPFAKLRLNYHNQYFLTAGATFQTNSSNERLGTSFNLGLDYMFDRTNPTEGAFVKFNFSDAQPRPFQNFYISNSFWWDNFFKNTQTLNLAVGARWRGFSLRADHTAFYNYIGLTSTGFVQNGSDDGAFSVFKTTLEKTFKFWSILAFDTRLVYQQVLASNAKVVMNLPTFSTRNALYFDFDLLQTTPTQIGVDLYYNTPYYSNFYNPALGSFYNQNEFQIGGFPFVDVFLNLRVQRANLFLRYTNIWTGIFGHNHAMTNGYPVPGGTIRFGVLWRFYD